MTVGKNITLKKGKGGAISREGDGHFGEDVFRKKLWMGKNIKL